MTRSGGQDAKGRRRRRGTRRRRGRDGDSESVLTDEMDKTGETDSQKRKKMSENDRQHEFFKLSFIVDEVEYDTHGRRWDGCRRSDETEVSQRWRRF